MKRRKSADLRVWFGRAAPAMTLGLALTLGACGGGAPQTYDLSAATPAAQRPFKAQLVVREPTASLDLDSQRILVRTGHDTLANLAGAQWSDRLPSLVQTRLVQTFQNARLLRSVSRSGNGVSADYALELDIRNFELDAQRHVGHVDIAVRIVAVTSGRVVAAQIFDDSTPAAGTGGAAATAALNAALTNVMTRIVAFSAKRL